MKMCITQSKFEDEHLCNVMPNGKLTARRLMFDDGSAGLEPSCLLHHQCHPKQCSELMVVQLEPGEISIVLKSWSGQMTDLFRESRKFMFCTEILSLGVADELPLSMGHKPSWF